MVDAFRIADDGVDPASVPQRVLRSGARMPAIDALIQAELAHASDVPGRPQQTGHVAELGVSDYQRGECS